MKRLLGAALFAFSAYANAEVIKNFTGVFDLANFTQTPNGGSIDTTRAPLSVALTSSDTGHPIYVWGNNPDFGDQINVDWTEITIKANQNYIIKFDYDYLSSNDYGTMGPAYYERFGVVNNGTFRSLIVIGPDVPAHQFGTSEFGVKTGDVFGFRAAPVDSSWGSATTIISNFSAAYVPEPGSVALLGIGLLGFVASRRKRWKN